jgi:hypothetical protein
MTDDEHLHVFLAMLIGPAISSLCNEFLREEAQRIQLQDIGEPEYHFLDPSRLQLCQVPADGSRTADEIAVDTVPGAQTI